MSMCLMPREWMNLNAESRQRELGESITLQNSRPGSIFLECIRSRPSKLSKKSARLSRATGYSNMENLLPWVYVPTSRMICACRNSWRARTSCRTVLRFRFLRRMIVFLASFIPLHRTRSTVAVAPIPTTSWRSSRSILSSFLKVTCIPCPHQAVSSTGLLLRASLVGLGSSGISCTPTGGKVFATHSFGGETEFSSNNWCNLNCFNSFLDFIWPGMEGAVWNLSEWLGAVSNRSRLCRPSPLFLEYRSRRVDVEEIASSEEKIKLSELSDLPSGAWYWSLVSDKLR